MPSLLVLASAPPPLPSGLPRAIIAPAAVAAIRPGLEVGSLAKTMFDARTGDVGAWRVMVPLEGVVLEFLHA